MLPILATSFGPRRAGPPPDLMSLPTADLLELADQLDQVADFHLLEGNPASADRLTLHAHGLPLRPSRWRKVLNEHCSGS